MHRLTAAETLNHILCHRCHAYSAGAGTKGLNWLASPVVCELGIDFVSWGSTHLSSLQHTNHELAITAEDQTGTYFSPHSI